MNKTIVCLHINIFIFMMFFQGERFACEKIAEGHHKETYE